MLSSFIRPSESKETYFKLSNSLQLSDPILSSTYKIAGLYALYKDDICLYVGQSKNIPSRLSTHLTGRYKTADRIDVYFVCYDMFSDFYGRTKSSQTSILVNNENHLINTLKPIENIIVDRSVVDDDLLFVNLIDGPSPPYHDAQIFLDDEYLTVTDDPHYFLDVIDIRVRNTYKKCWLEIAKAQRND